MSDPSPSTSRIVTTSIRIDRDKQTRFLAAIRAKDPRDDMSKALRRHVDEVIEAYESESAAA